MIQFTYFIPPLLFKRIRLLDTRKLTVIASEWALNMYIFIKFMKNQLVFKHITKIPYLEHSDTMDTPASICDT